MSKSFFTVHSDPYQKRLFFWAIGISLAGHLILLAVIVMNPQWSGEKDPFASAIDVQMVSVKDIPDTASGKTAAFVKKIMSDKPKPIRKTFKKRETKKAEIDPAPAETADSKKPEVSISRKPVKTKTAMKYKTLKLNQNFKKALARLKKNADEPPARTLEDTIRELREKMDKGEFKREVPKGQRGAQKGRSGPGSKREAQIEEIYMALIASEIQENWAYADQLSSDNEKGGKVAITILPDGSIVDISFMDRSGNRYLDESVEKAIRKSSPVQPYPEGLRKSRIVLGLNYTPQGVSDY
ncbi:MAG: hypothetical protein GY874_05070 [Desulfobacteraceae bacterium]|nr:hypothetical protein [Desulfobacteraceae bacterium]